MLLQSWWDTSVKYIKGVGPAKAALLAKLDIFTNGHLLEHYPSRYEDRSQLKPMQYLVDGQLETFCATVTGISESKPRRGLTITKVTVTDHTAMGRLEWFNQAYVKRQFAVGMQLIISGKVKRNAYGIQLTSPEVEKNDGSDPLHTGRIVPVYQATENVSQRFLRTLIYQVLQTSPDIPEELPGEIISEYSLINKNEALDTIHFPTEMGQVKYARRRLVFEELYFLQCALGIIKQSHKQACEGVKHAPDGLLMQKIYQSLPFTLTADQQTAYQEIKADMEDVTPMQRLLQGDVGSGKTVIAAMALAKTVENGYQGALMAPTEILAEQHYHTLARLMSPLGIRLVILSGKLTRRTREEVLARIRDGLVDIVVGTHALIQEDVEFKQLGLVVTDEQHRFGVGQRAKLQEKGTAPDVLVMTATPIPRTMALTVYGDLDVSAIRQLPPGRKAVRTFIRDEFKRPAVYQFVVKEVNKGRQAYVVCPLVEESEKLVAQSAVKLYDELTQTYLKGITCGLVHGRMKAQEKDKVMALFYAGDIQVLIATTVIEVGVNVPNATIMIIEGADRFGLAQLHQLRGRIGRGEYQSYCVLLSDNKSTETRERLKIMETTSDGFVLAEKDLLLRGPGQFFGTRQHGMPDLKIANIVEDVDILLEARQAAEQTIASVTLMAKIKDIVAARMKNQFNGIFNH